MQLVLPLQVCGVEYLMPHDVEQVASPETLVNMQRLSAVHKPDPSEMLIDSQAVTHLPLTHAQSVFPLHSSMDCTCEQSVLHFPSTHWHPCCEPHCVAVVAAKTQRVVQIARTGFQSQSDGSAVQVPCVVRNSQSLTHCPVTVLTSHPVSFLQAVKSRV